MPEITETLAGQVPPVVPSAVNAKEGSGCQVPGCVADLSVEKPYNRRLKVCAEHLKAQAVQLHVGASRFCQQCSRFHTVEAFDGSRRSCRDRLKTHNQRRKRRKEPEAEIPAAHPLPVPSPTSSDSSGSLQGSDIWRDTFYTLFEPQEVQFVPGAMYAAPTAPQPQMLYPVNTVFAKDMQPHMWLGGFSEDSNAFCYPDFRPAKFQALSHTSDSDANSLPLCSAPLKVASIFDEIEIPSVNDFSMPEWDMGDLADLATDVFDVGALGHHNPSQQSYQCSAPSPEELELLQHLLPTPL